MKLRSLRNQDPKTVQGILSALTLDLLPNPGIDTLNSSRLSISNHDPDILIKVLHEVRERLNLLDNDKSQVAQTKVYNFIANEMSKVVLQGKDTSKTKERLGQKGILRPDQYQVKFIDSFKKVFPQLGIRPAHVESAIHHPDDVQHLLPEQFGFSDGSAASLYVKNYDVNDKMSLLVHADRKGYTQHVHEAWRIYHSDVDMSGISSPLDLLKAFTNVYGLNVTIGGESSKFFLYEKRSLPDKAHEMKLIEFEAPKGTDIYQNFMVRNLKEENSTEVALAFAINLSKYKNDLQNHKL